MIETIQEVTDAQLCIDTPNAIAMEAGLEVVKGKVLMNSTTAETDKMDKLFPLAAKYNADIISLTLNEKGILIAPIIGIYPPLMCHRKVAAQFKVCSVRAATWFRQTKADGDLSTDQARQPILFDSVAGMVGQDLPVERA